MIWSYNDTDLRVLRETCHAFRDLHDRVAVRQIGLDTTCRLQGWQPPSPEDIEATVHGALARGCKPAVISLALLNVDEAADLRMLSLVRAVTGAASVTRVKLGGHTSITEEVARAIAGVSPALACLSIRQIWTNAAAESARASGAPLLLQLSGSGGLRDLELNEFSLQYPIRDLDSVSYCTALTRIYLTCDLSEEGDDGGLAAESSMLRTLSALTGLRHLELGGGASRPADSTVRHARAASLESWLSPLTALTTLNLGSHCLRHVSWDSRTLWQLESEGRYEEAKQLEAAMAAEWRALAAATRHMPHLRELISEARVNVADLSSLTTLTLLAVRDLALPADRRQQNTTGVYAQAGRQHAPPAYDLPPLLKRLAATSPLPLDVAAALCRPPVGASAASAPASAIVGLSFHDWIPGQYADSTHVWPAQKWHLRFEKSRLGAGSYLDEEGCLTSEAVEDVRSAIASLKAAFLPSPPPPPPLPPAMAAAAAPPTDSSAVAGGGSKGSYLRLVIKAGSTGGSLVLPPAPVAAADEGGDTHCDSWLGPILAELPPLHTLRLGGLVLSPRDMLHLGRCADGVMVLDLSGCSYRVASLPLLGGLTALRELVLRYDDWEGGLQAFDLEAALLALTAPLGAGVAVTEDGKYGPHTRLPLPSLDYLRIGGYSREYRDWLAAWIEPTIRRELSRRPGLARLYITNIQP